ncbi:uncharacterized protein LOC109838246 [Asparagus officinalis]|uniref:uncharacterized protein LOC109838246 n=1 Tax=Asparagus officinalis TaxID=4686 RepID=UPI00098E0FF2|nr:uncharacterized protein LOC109838246 [Asparagus officinalis]
MALFMGILEEKEVLDRGIPYLHICLFWEFSSATGLCANPDKCQVFFGGVNEDTKDSINAYLGFTVGTLPIRYLGLPLVCKRLSYLDCNPLLSKISSQFQTWNKAKNLSYAGKIQVIKSVILGVQIYWTSCYILPVGVLQKIDDMCRNFLWGREGHIHKPSLVAWEKICRGKKSGGLGIFSARLWNFASALKIIWDIHMNKEILWIKWIHGKYLKNRDIWHVNSKPGDSWLWRQLLKSRDRALVLAGGIDNLNQIMVSCYKNSKVKISAIYQAFVPHTPPVPWYNTVWERMNYPKHSIIGWLTVQNRLLTQDRIMNWLNFRWRSCSWSYLLNWYNNCLRGKGFKKGIKRMAFSATLYKIWGERNNRIFLLKSKGIEQLVKEIKVDILIIALNGSTKPEDRECIISL